jgi:hypothetical protein
MTEAPDVYPEFPDDDAAESDDQGVEGQGVEGQGVEGQGVEGWVRAEADAEQVRTGDARVDAVLASLDGLSDRPVSEHAVVFEQAHERLRAALEPGRESA